jgi:hypothetical protein
MPKCIEGLSIEHKNTFILETHFYKKKHFVSNWHGIPAHQIMSLLVSVCKVIRYQNFIGGCPKTNMWELDDKVVDNFKADIYLELLTED